MKPEFKITLFFILITLSACKDREQDLSLLQPSAIDRITRVSISTGAQYSYEYLGSFKDGDRVRLTSDVDLYEWTKISDALSSIPSDDRFICGLTGTFSLAAKIEYQLKLKRGDSIDLVFPDSEETFFVDDPTSEIRMLSPSPFLSFVLSQNKYNARDIYLVERGGVTSNNDQNAWDDQAESLRNQTITLRADFDRSTSDAKARMAMKSAELYLRMLGISEGWKTLFLEDRDWLAWTAARSAVEMAASLEGDAAVEANEILSIYGNSGNQ